MFNFSSSSGLLAGQHDLEKERAPPARPVDVTFPSLTPPQPSLDTLPSAWSGDAQSALPRHFISLKRPSDISLDTLATLNVSFEPTCDFETLVPAVSRDGQPYLPPRTWLQTPEPSELETSSSSEPSALLLSNGRKAPERREFHSRAKELYFKNEDAFSSLTRKARGGQAPLRLAHFRRFWEGLDNMAYYWDNSLDEYLPPKPDADANSDAKPSAGTEIKNAHTDMEEPRKKAKTSVNANETTTLPINLVHSATVRSSQPTSIASSKALPPRVAPPKVPWAMNMQEPLSGPPDLSKGSYRGYRIGNGPEMPDQYRLECVRSFLEPIAWAFGVTFMPHRRPPVLVFQHVRFPVRMNTVGWRGPADRIKARQGWLEGPVLGVQCRPETNFGSPSTSDAESVLDVVRELGGLLLLAQERAREGRNEKRGGDGKWWTTVPRWGGGPGGEVGEALGASEDVSVGSTSRVEEKLDGKPEEKATYASRLRVGSISRDRKRPSPAEIWKILRPGNPLWDPKIVYEAIGKPRDAEWDEVFMVSSINHHISILKLRVHSLYLRYLAEGILPESEPADPRWSSPILQRTRWYDLFNVDDRVEAMRGLWGVVGYQMRARDQQKEKEDVTMKDS